MNPPRDTDGHRGDFDRVFKPTLEIQKKRCKTFAERHLMWHSNQTKYIPQLPLFSQKVVLKKELTWTNIHGFQAKRAVIWPQPWNSLSEFTQNGHDCASWDDKQCCRRDISTCFTEKPTFHFRRAAKPCFLWSGYRGRRPEWHHSIIPSN